LAFGLYTDSSSAGTKIHNAKEQADQSHSNQMGQFK
jgi:hypothetical protein